MQFYGSFLVCSCLFDWEVNGLIHCKELQRWIRFCEVFISKGSLSDIEMLKRSQSWQWKKDSRKKKKRKAPFYNMFFLCNISVWLSACVLFYLCLSTFLSLFWLLAHLGEQFAHLLVYWFVLYHFVLFVCSFRNILVFHFFMSISLFVLVCLFCVFSVSIFHLFIYLFIHSFFLLSFLHLLVHYVCL